jgi:hypothetical protein
MTYPKTLTINLTPNLYGESKMTENTKLIEDLENSKSDMEEAYKNSYGFYPPQWGEYFEYGSSSYYHNLWVAFQKGWKASKQSEV